MVDQASKGAFSTRILKSNARVSMQDNIAIKNDQIKEAEEYQSVHNMEVNIALSNLEENLLKIRD